MVLLIKLPDRDRTKKVINSASGYVPILAQMLFFTSAPKWLVFILLFGSSLLSTFTHKGGKIPFDNQNHRQ